MAPWILPFTEWRIHRQWVRAGRPIPAPPLVKQRIVREYLWRYRLDTVIETGTFTGDMVQALRGRARRIVSIELDDTLYANACRRFSGVPAVELQRFFSNSLRDRLGG